MGRTCVYHALAASAAVDGPKQAPSGEGMFLAATTTCAVMLALEAAVFFALVFLRDSAVCDRDRGQMCYQ